MGIVRVYLKREILYPIIGHSELINEKGRTTIETASIYEFKLRSKLTESFYHNDHDLSQMS
jgi:hypothetical protein